MCLSNSIIDGAEADTQLKSLFRSFSVEWTPTIETIDLPQAIKMASTSRYVFDAGFEFTPATDNAALQIDTNESNTDHVKAIETESIELPSSPTRGFGPATTVWSSDGLMIAKWGPDMPLVLLNEENGQALVDFSTLLPRNAIVRFVGFLSPDDKFVTIVLEDESSAFVWSLAKHQFVSTPSSTPHEPTVPPVVQKSESNHRDAIQDRETHADVSEPIELPSSQTRGLGPVTSVCSFDGSMIAKWGPETPLSLSYAGNRQAIVEFSSHFLSTSITNVEFTLKDRALMIELDDESVWAWSIKNQCLTSL